MEKEQQSGNKKYIRGFISTLAFILIFTLLFLLASNLLRRKPAGQSNLVNSFYDEPKNTIDVLFMGSSHVYYSIIPMEIWNEYGITSHVIASPSQSDSMTYYLLKSALHYQKPKVVVLEGYYLMSDCHFFDEGKMRDGIDSMPLFSKERIEFINLALSDLSIKDRIPYYIPFIKYHNRWKELEDYGFYRPTFFKGCRLTGKITPLEIPKYDNIPEVPLPDFGIEYFHKIADLCKENDITLAVYYSPIADANGNKRDWYLDVTGKSLTAEKLCEEAGVPFIKIHTNDDLGLDHNTDFKDNNHMNVLGAQKVSKYLGKVLLEEFDVPTHKEDPAFQKWNEDYEEYVDYAENIVDIGDTEEDEVI